MTSTGRPIARAIRLAPAAAVKAIVAGSAPQHVVARAAVETHRHRCAARLRQLQIATALGTEAESADRGGCRIEQQKAVFRVGSDADGATLIVVACTLSGEAPTTTVAPTTVAPTTVPVVPAEVTTTTAAVAAAAELPHTGSTSMLAVALGFLVLAAGLGLMFAVRRTAKAS